MNEAADQNRGSRAVREQHRFDYAKLDRLIVADVNGYAGQMTAEEFKGEQSKQTCRVAAPTGTAVVLDTGAISTSESSMTKIAVSEARSRVANSEVYAISGSSVTRYTMVEAFYPEIRAFRIYDGPTEVHRWPLAKKIRCDQLSGNVA